jgi:long-subunit fatty acid transport protein
MKSRLGTGALVVAGLLGAGPAPAQSVQNVVLRNSFNPVGAGARGLGMGGAFIAVADDGTAASFNPAGLSQLRRTELAAVGFTDDLTSTLLIPHADGTVQSKESKTRHSRPDFFGLAVPFEVGGKNLTVQLSYQRSVDLIGKGEATVQDTVKLSEIEPGLTGTGDFIADITPEQSGAFHTVSLSAGYEVTSRLSFGTSINYWIGDWTARGNDSFRLRVKAPGSAARVEVPLFNTQFDQKQSVRALSVNLGLLLKYPRVSLGAVLRMPFVGDYELDENDVQTSFVQGKPQDPVPASVGVTSRLHWPRSVGAGLALRPFKGLTLAADYANSRWSQTFLEDVPAGALLTPVKTGPSGEREDSFNNRNFFDLLPASQTATRNTSLWRAGGEYLAVLPRIVIPFRGGLFRDHSPIAELGTEEGKLIKGWTAGTGLNFSRLVLDVAYERRSSEGRVFLRLQRGQPVQTSGNVSTEKVRQDRIVASLIYRAGGSDDPIKRLLHSIFVGPREKDQP